MANSLTALRETNRRLITETVRKSGALTQAQLARQTGLSPATVSTIVRELRDAGLVEISQAGGRRHLISPARETGVVVGVDFGHSHLRVALAERSHRVLAEEAIPFDVGARAPEGLSAAERLIIGLLERAGVSRTEIKAVGLGLPGPIDPQTGIMGSSTILPGWAGVDPAAELGRRLGVPVVVDNDANLGALAEATWGAAKGRREVAYMKIGTGVGASILINGLLYRGATGTAGELGHITIDENGRLCRCGNRGCLETLAGGQQLIDLVRPTHGQVTVSRLVELAHGGDIGCRRVIADAGRHLGVAVASLCNILNPGLVVIGGALAEAGPLLIEPIMAVVGRLAIPSAARAVNVVKGELGERAGVLGALARVQSPNVESAL
ncbi:ROK family transcriptional regulator [Herbidospora sp. NBRC 101105]|uniref:ROK family transcriptional regulator n=1 Tax=Herbidospora sp. NBRC 101105 TaxID=3032195 RepID=UPI0024A0C716|nr:ROK family transcriptional regulator [Herbidospora sp. NBRC 101105]GLX98368.1 transcriptional regulator [Herbidospora sp. NBRC 101105]